MPRKISWAQFCADRDEEAAIEIDAPKGEAFRIPPAERWAAKYRAATTDDERGVAILGATEWKRWVATGRTYEELDQFFMYAERVTPGE